MKSTSQNFRVLFCAVLSCWTASAFAATEATTDPVGFITLAASGGSSAAPKLSLISPTLTQPVLWQGTISQISGTTLTVSGTPWTSNQFNGSNGSHYVEIVSTTTPANSGTLSEITNTATSAITTFDNLTVNSRAAVGDTIKIRKDVTISDLFGATNTAGLLGSADDATTADEVLIYSGSSSVSYFYFTGSGNLAAGWRNSNGFALAGNTPIAPHEAVVIKRKTSGNVTFTFAGAVKTGNTLIPINSGLNVVGTSSAKGLTLATSNLYTGNNNTGVVPSADDSTTADEVVLYDATGTPKSYFYFSGGGALAAGWRASNGFTLSNDVAIPPGNAFVVKRKSGAAFNWALPSPSSF